MLCEIALENIRPPRYILRPVKKHTVAYLELIDSIKDSGLWQPIFVRPLEDGSYEIVDGYYRFTCYKQLHFETIPCFIRELTDHEVLSVQIQTNAIRAETQPVEFAVQIERLMQAHPDLSLPKLSIMLRKSEGWISKTLSLRKLRSKYQTMVKRSELRLMQAYELARLPQALQDNYINEAIKLPAVDFVKLVRRELKEYREAVHRGHIQKWVDRIKPVPYLRPFQALASEHANPREAGPVLIKMAAKSAMDGWKACLAWVLHYDPDGLAEQEEMIEARRQRVLSAELRRQKSRERLKVLREQHEGIVFLDSDFEE